MASNDESTFDDNSSELNEERERAVEELGWRAGAALRHPAPPHGMTAIARQARNRRLAGAGAAIAGVATIVVIGILTLDRDDTQQQVNTPITLQPTVPTKVVQPTAPPSAPPSAPAPTSPPTEAGGPPAGLYGGEGDGLDAWPEYVEFRDDGTGRLVIPTGRNRVNPTDVEFEYTADADRVTFTREAFEGCPRDPQRPAVYGWSLDDVGLVLTAIDEPCPRAMPPLPPRWRPLGHPLVAKLPIDEPLVVETALGKIEWTAFASTSFLSNLANVTDGYVALRYGRSGPSTEIVRSSDGRNWAPIPSPPTEPPFFDPSRLVVRDDVLYVIPGSGAPSPRLQPVHSTDDWGSTWVEVPMEPDTSGTLFNVTGIVAGDGGVVVNSRDEMSAVEAGSAVWEIIQGPLWVLGDARFDRVEAPFTGQPGEVQVHAVDGGFFAYPNSEWRMTDDGLQQPPEDGPTESWFSPDGRTWTELTGRPPNLTLTAVNHGTIYAVSDPPGPVEDDVVSTDGGHTWTSTSEKPPAPGMGIMAVSDRWFVMGAWPLNWGPCTGVVWVSVDGEQWARALDLPLGTCTYDPTVIVGDTIVIHASRGASSVTWVGTVT